jgi:hypothetical protein
MDREPREVDEAGVAPQQDPAVVALDVHNVVRRLLIAASRT